MNKCNCNKGKIEGAQGGCGICSPIKMQQVQVGENINCDVAVVGCYLLKAGIVRKEKEEIKKIVYDIIIKQRAYQKKEVLKDLLKKIKSIPLCYDDGITENENDVDFARGQAHFKGHCKELIESLI